MPSFSALDKKLSTLLANGAPRTGFSGRQRRGLISSHPFHCDGRGHARRRPGQHDRVYQITLEIELDRVDPGIALRASYWQSDRPCRVGCRQRLQLAKPQPA